jgi:hypothetical protein
MELDKDLYRQVYAAYREWNAGEAAERGRSAGQLSPAQAWQRYADLIEFCWWLSPEPSVHQRREKLAALDRYYDAVRRLEARRQAHGNTA